MGTENKTTKIVTFFFFIIFLFTYQNAKTHAKHYYGKRKKHYINQYENTKRNEKKTSILSVFSFLGCQNAETHEKQYIRKNRTTLPKTWILSVFHIVR